MKILAILLTVLAAIISIGGLVEPEHRFRIVSKYYNFSAGFPDVPTVSTDINDEGLNKHLWTVKRNHGTWAEYFVVSATCYKEALDPTKELDSADSQPGAGSQNGIEVLQSERTQVRALETGRELPAFFRSTKDTATGSVIFHKLILDRYCLIDAGARADKNVGAASLFMQSVSILK